MSGAARRADAARRARASRRGLIDGACRRRRGRPSSVDHAIRARAATSGSWVAITSAKPSSRRAARRSGRAPALRCRSRDGRSARRRAAAPARWASARAIATRCASPPDSSAGSASSLAASPTSASSVLPDAEPRPSRALTCRGERDVLVRGEVRQQVGALEHVGDRPARGLARGRRRRARTAARPPAHLAARRARPGRRARAAASSCPIPSGPSSADPFARGDRQVDVGERASPRCRRGRRRR